MLSIMNSEITVHFIWFSRVLLRFCLPPVSFPLSISLPFFLLSLFLPAILRHHHEPFNHPRNPVHLRFNHPRNPEIDKMKKRLEVADLHEIQGKVEKEMGADQDGSDSVLRKVLRRYEYRHVVLPAEVAKLLPKNLLLSEILELSNNLGNNTSKLVVQPEKKPMFTRYGDLMLESEERSPSK